MHELHASSAHRTAAAHFDRRALSVHPAFRPFERVVREADALGARVNREERADVRAGRTHEAILHRDQSVLRPAVARVDLDRRARKLLEAVGRDQQVRQVVLKAHADVTVHEPAVLQHDAPHRAIFRVAGERKGAAFLVLEVSEVAAADLEVQAAHDQETVASLLPATVEVQAFDLHFLGAIDPEQTFERFAFARRKEPGASLAVIGGLQRGLAAQTNRARHLPESRRKREALGVPRSGV